MISEVGNKFASFVKILVIMSVLERNECIVSWGSDLYDEILACIITAKNLKIGKLID